MANSQECFLKVISEKEIRFHIGTNSLFVWVIPRGYKLKTAFTGRRV